MPCTISAIVALTANAMKSDREKYIEAGAVDYLTKPLDLDHFYEVITGYLTLKQAAADEKNMTPEGVAPESAAQQQTSVMPKTSSGFFNDFAEDEEFQELLQEFIGMLPELVNEITTAAQREDWEALKAVSHRLKGSGGSYGFPQLTELARKINDDVKTAYFEHISKSVHELNAVTQSIIDAHNTRAAS